MITRELTRTQQDEIDRLAADYASVGVRHLNLGPAVELTIYLESPSDDETDPASIILFRKAYGPEGEMGCWACGSIERVDSRGAYGDLCENCHDHILNPL